MQTLSHGISAVSVNNTHEWMSVDTPLRNLKAETTMVPFHRVQQGNYHQDSKTDETLLGSFYLFQYSNPGKIMAGKRKPTRHECATMNVTLKFV